MLIYSRKSEANKKDCQLTNERENVKVTKALEKAEAG